MKSALNIFFMILLGLSVSFCSMFSKSTDSEQQVDSEQTDAYSAANVFTDIEDEAADERQTSSQDYSDDDYGSVDEGSSDDEVLLSGADEPVVDEPSSTSLPVETLQSEEPQAPQAASVAPSFKNGMYRISVNCNMRAEPSARAAKAGKIPKGKKLWVEKHNKNWVKVYKKSGPVFINKLCL